MISWGISICLPQPMGLTSKLAILRHDLLLLLRRNPSLPRLPLFTVPQLQAWSSLSSSSYTTTSISFHNSNSSSSIKGGSGIKAFSESASSTMVKAIRVHEPGGPEVSDNYIIKVNKPTRTQKPIFYPPLNI